MKPSLGWLLAAGLLVVVMVVLLGRWLLVEIYPDMQAQTKTDTHLPGDLVVAGLESGEGDQPVLMPREDVPLPPVAEGPPVDAIASLKQAREAGDARAPEVVRSPEREAPTAAELADPEAYQRYEARQNERLYRSYVKSAEREIPVLQDQIAKGKQGGLTPEQIAEGEEKLRRIEAMRFQLMSDHPELNRTPPSDE